MYRPDGWKNRFGNSTELRIHNVVTCHHCIYEAGADAMLEGLRNLKHNLSIPGDRPVEIGWHVQKWDGRDGFTVTLHKKGLLVFIPDEV